MARFAPDSSRKTRRRTSTRAGPLEEGGALGLDHRSVLFRGPRAFFLTTYPRVEGPARCWSDAPGRSAATRLYARVSSSQVWSGRLSISPLSTDKSTGDSHPPRFHQGSTVPVSRWRCTQRIKVAGPIAKRAATSLYVSVRDLVRAHRSLPQLVRIRIRHARNRSQNHSQLK